MNSAAAGWAWRRRVSPAGAKLVLMALSSFSDPQGYYRAPRGRLAGLTSQGERTVRRHLEALERAGLISRCRRIALTGRYRPDLYYVNPQHDSPARAGVAIGGDL